MLQPAQQSPQELDELDELLLLCLLLELLTEELDELEDREDELLDEELLDEEQQEHGQNLPIPGGSIQGLRKSRRQRTSRSAGAPSRRREWTGDASGSSRRAACLRTSDL